MNDSETGIRLAELEKKIDSIYESLEKTRKYSLWALVITIAVIVLPLIGIAFVLPSFLSTYTTSLQEAGL